jgi:hypothetical protein
VSNLSQQLRAALAFDEYASGQAAAEHIVKFRDTPGVDLCDSHDFGAKWQHARLAPLLEKLVKIAEACERELEITSGTPFWNKGLNVALLELKSEVAGE